MLLLNRNDNDGQFNVSVDFALVPGLNHTQRNPNASQRRVHVVDVYTNEDQGVATGGLTRAVPSHGVVVLRLRLVESAPVVL